MSNTDLLEAVHLSLETFFYLISSCEPHVMDIGNAMQSAWRNKALNSTISTPSRSNSHAGPKSQSKKIHASMTMTELDISNNLRAISFEKNFVQTPKSARSLSPVPIISSKSTFDKKVTSDVDESVSYPHRIVQDSINQIPSTTEVTVSENNQTQECFSDAEEIVLDTNDLDAENNLLSLFSTNHKLTRPLFGKCWIHHFTQETSDSQTDQNVNRQMLAERRQICKQLRS